MSLSEQLTNRENELLNQVKQVSQKRNQLIAGANQIQQKLEEADGMILQLNGQLMEIKHFKTMLPVEEQVSDDSQSESAKADELKTEEVKTEGAI